MAHNSFASGQHPYHPLESGTSQLVHRRAPHLDHTKTVTLKPGSVERWDTFTRKAQFEKANQGDEEAQRQIIHRSNLLMFVWSEPMLKKALQWSALQQESPSTPTALFLFSYFKKSDIPSFESLKQRLTEESNSQNSDATLALAYVTFANEESRAEALGQYLMAYEQGHPVGAYQAAVIYLTQNKPERAQPLLLAAHEVGLAQASLKLIRNFSYSDVSIIDHAAEQGLAEAEFMKGYYLSKYASAREAEKVVAYYTRAAEQGYAEAFVRLGTCYKDGYGVTANVAMAQHWFLKQKPIRCVLNYMKHVLSLTFVWLQNIGFCQRIEKEHRHLKLCFIMNLRTRPQ